jgi:hypothetical protein
MNDFVANAALRQSGKIKRVSPQHRFVIALHSPETNERNRTGILPSREGRGIETF